MINRRYFDGCFACEISKTNWGEARPFVITSLNHMVALELVVPVSCLLIERIRGNGAIRDREIASIRTYLVA